MFSCGGAASEDLHWSSTRPSLTNAVARARSQYGDDEAGDNALVADLKLKVGNHVFSNFIRNSKRCRYLRFYEVLWTQPFQQYTTSWASPISHRAVSIGGRHFPDSDFLT